MCESLGQAVPEAGMITLELSITGAHKSFPPPLYLSSLLFSRIPGLPPTDLAYFPHFCLN